MKHFFLLCFVLITLGGYSQVIADPAFDQINITDNIGNDIDEFALPLGGVYVLRVPIRNLNTITGLPTGSCKVKIGLGSKLIMDPDFNLNGTNTSSFFDWTAVEQGGQVQLTGELKTDLPPGYNVTLLLRVKGNLLGSSTITTNFLVTNHNTAITLSDEDPSNNISFMPYTVVTTIPVDFTGISARKEGCNVNVQFSAENELNVDRYEIEVSKDGTHYTKMGQVPANRSINYQFAFALTAAIESPVLRIRVKSVDRDGKVQYTPIITVKGSCSGSLAVQLFPNPLLQHKTTLTIEALSGRLNGLTTVVLMDATGRVLRNSTVNLVNAQQFTYDAGALPAGQYLLRLQGLDTVDAPVVLRFQKM